MRKKQSKKPVDPESKRWEAIPIKLDAYTDRKTYKLKESKHPRFKPEN